VVTVETFKRKLAIATTGQSTRYDVDPWVRREDGIVYGDGERLGDHAGPLCGLAIDVGTTTVVMHLVDLESGELLEIHAFENPQKYGGSDVLNRISYDRGHPGQLHQTIIGRVNHAIAELPGAGANIFAMTVAGNPTMRDVFFGLDVQPIGQSPFMSTTQHDLAAGRRASTAIMAEAGELGLMLPPRARVYGLPLISHHVGADIAAVLATLPLETDSGAFMMIDIGTNTEVVAGAGEKLFAASCAAGPAFEGGRVHCGMPACDGAIAALRRYDGRWDLTSIGDGPPRGICGSGLVDILAELRASNEMDEMGRFDGALERVMVSETPSIALSRQDASELALTKAAIGLGQSVLLRKLGVHESQLETYYLAGAFANHLDLERARRIGLILPVPDDRIARIGNASVEGAKAVLLSRTCRDHVESLVRRIEHVALEQEPDFFDLYASMTRLQPIELT
jgi:uncharacterized 2Fe-2S/4Fe-4S cluster protein (DUF4445 family)